jgi:hypothetical protein
MCLFIFTNQYKNVSFGGIEMIIVWDLDGTLLKDGGNYNKAITENDTTPLFVLLENMQEHENICITGRNKIPTIFNGLFQKELPRDWEPFDWAKYYPQYFQWKVNMIRMQQADLVFEDDQQIVRHLTSLGINCIWTPQYAFMGNK